MSNLQRQEVWHAVEQMTKSLATLAERSPNMSVHGKDFNDMLKRARVALPNSPALQDMNDIPESTTLADLLVKLAIIGGALTAANHAENLPMGIAGKSRFLQGLDDYVKD